MKYPVLFGILLLAATSAHAQQSSAGGVRSRGGDPAGMSGSGGASGPPVSRPPRSHEFDPVRLREFESAVEDMFREGDTNRDGMITRDELRDIFVARRQAVIRDRFERLDTNRSGQIDEAEFIVWQENLGTAASSEAANHFDEGPIEEVIRPERADGMLMQLIEPLGTLLVTSANTNYDAGMSLAEFQTYEKARFDAADHDGDGRVTIEELPQLNTGPVGPGRIGDPPPVSTPPRSR